MDDDPVIACPNCDRRFYVVWIYDGLGSPEYCPMCGAEMDYRAAREKEYGCES